MKKSSGVIVTIIVSILPIIWCCINYININKEYEKNKNDMESIQSMKDDINDVIEKDMNKNNVSGEDDASSGGANNSTEKDDIGKPIGKIVEGATINVSVANVFDSPDEKSNIVGTVTKNTEVTAQAYPKEWSTVKVGELSGWMKTEYITLPEAKEPTTIGSVIGKTAIIDVESLNVREKPVSGKIVTQLTKGTDVKILAVNDDETWYQVQWRTTLGWVSSEYVKVQY